ncbi:cellulose/xylan binding protein with CBM9 domain [Dysgonomonas alginatilytica]|uniref:Cellulose/xylan binding protein with CBM9 domain n=1 Tax=Dysgonomonas alginatilytica TaxID=1605892 RepID=A0A2V3Q1L6_9BACT|nr:carbohydrate-binding family 9-like protein [Dysgonomonas alginatilytica]PXV69205.1 cellulose/xylan binding protein with CBM9 domain [Dysgonomonas alginatilytica]
MNKIKIPKISIDASDIEAVAQQMASLPVNKIDTINWPDAYPSKPEVTFTIAHNSENILLQYKVKENEILAAVTTDNGEVWTDSCVEMFLSFDNKHYYNAEFTCIGKALLGYREFGGSAEHGSKEVMQSILRLPSLGTANRDKEIGNFDWTLTIVIPCAAFWKSDIQSFDGLQVKGNFYKCGDNLTVPHFVSWTTIGTPSPSFHQPRFFGELIFE